MEKDSNIREMKREISDLTERFENHEGIDEMMNEIEDLAFPKQKNGRLEIVQTL